MKKAFKVFITNNAQDDLKHIFYYISEDSPNDAKIFIAGLEAKIHSLAALPERAAYIPENVFFGTDYRQLIYKKYRVIFRVDDHRIFILRVIHGAKLLEL